MAFYEKKDKAYNWTKCSTGDGTQEPIVRFVTEQYITGKKSSSIKLVVYCLLVVNVSRKQTTQNVYTAKL